jgi:spore germination protein
MTIPQNISKDITANAAALKSIFRDSGDFIMRVMQVGVKRDITIAVAYIDMLADANTLNEYIIEPLLLGARQQSPEGGESDVLSQLKTAGITMADFKETDDFDACVNAVLSADTVLFAEGSDKALIISTKGFPNRGVPEADSEVTLTGGKEAFSEVMRINTALIRRRIKDPQLKIKQMTVGRRGRADVAVVYLEDVVRPQVLEETLKQIENIDMDAVFDSGYIEQFIEKDFSPFPRTQVTERPDKAASAVLEGRVAIIVDNSPFVVLVPATLNVFFQSGDDYYQRFGISAFTRALRYIAGILAVCLPGFYIAMSVYNPSMMPWQLVLKLGESRQKVPFPTYMEIIIMDLAFELLREAGLRLPKAVGGTIGIVGGIIVGQAAVEAGLVSPIAVIIVALTGICGFAVPSVALVGALRLSKYLIIIMSQMFGLLGFWVACVGLLTHLATLKSFGIPYLFPFVSAEAHATDIKDSIFRFPLFMMKKRPIFANPKNETRQEGESDV